MKTTKKILLVFIIIFVCCIIIFMLKIPRAHTLAAPFTKGAVSIAIDNKKPAKIYFIHNDTTIFLEVAKKNAELEKGLMYRASMPENHGMLFIFPNPRVLRFWMKNTLIPLDMIFLNHHRIVAIIPNIPPCPTETNPCPSYGPDTLADEVIELNAGVAKKMTIISGDVIMFKKQDVILKQN